MIVDKNYIENIELLLLNLVYQALMESFEDYINNQISFDDMLLLIARQGEGRAPR